MIDGIIPTRVIPQRTGGLPCRARADSPAIVLYREPAGFYRNDPERNLQLEISLHDFGLEKLYGRFLKKKLYSAHSPPVCGVLVDLHA